MYSGVETASHAGHCLIRMSSKLKLTVYKVYGEQNKSNENRPIWPAIGSLFLHPVYVCVQL